MSKRVLISDPKLIEEFKGQLEFVSRDENQWTETYINRDSGEKWLYYKVFSSMQGGGYPILGLIPIPTTNELINIAIKSDLDDEVYAACCTLIDFEESKKQEFRFELIDHLENIDDYSRQKQIIELTKLNLSFNRRATIGKSYDEVSKDYEYYKSIANRSEKLLNDK
jgi:hypothetical protein